MSNLPRGYSREQALQRIIRVDHAGEYGAKRIYEGQLAVLGKSASAPMIEHMKAQELEHLQAFEQLIVQNKVRPTFLLPLWHVGGFALGSITALMGEKAAMACTVAVEEVIDRHYEEQKEFLGTSEPELTAKISKFQAEEIEHRDAGLAHGAELTPAYSLLYTAVASITRGAIWLSKRV